MTRQIKHSYHNEWRGGAESWVMIWMFDLTSHELWKDLDLPSHELWNFISQKTTFSEISFQFFIQGAGTFVILVKILFIILWIFLTSEFFSVNCYHPLIGISWNVFISCTSPWYIISQNHISKSFLKIFAKNLSMSTKAGGIGK